jgi:hypothetical protein
MGDKEGASLLGERLEELADGDEGGAEAAEGGLFLDVGPEGSGEAVAGVLDVGMEEEEGEEGGGLAGREGMRQEETLLSELEAPQEADGECRGVRPER